MISSHPSQPDPEQNESTRSFRMAPGWKTLRTPEKITQKVKISAVFWGTNGVLLLAVLIFALR